MEKRTPRGLLMKGAHKLIDALAKAVDVHLEVPFQNFSLLRGQATVSQHFMFDDDDDDKADPLNTGVCSRWWYRAAKCSIAGRRNASEYLQRFRIELRHKPGKANVVPDALSRLASRSYRSESDESVLENVDAFPVSFTKRPRHE